MLLLINVDVNHHASAYSMAACLYHTWFYGSPNQMVVDISVEIHNQNHAQGMIVVLHFIAGMIAMCCLHIWLVAGC